MTGPSINNNYNNILAELGWPIKNGELSSQLVGQQWVKSLKGLLPLALTNNILKRRNPPTTLPILKPPSTPPTPPPTVQSINPLLIRPSFDLIRLRYYRLF